MAIKLPQLDTRDESEVVAQVIDDLPEEISDRNPSALEVKLIEGIGAFYGALLHQLDQVPTLLRLTMLNLLDLEPSPAKAASVTLSVTRHSTTTSYTLPAGTIVKTGTDVSAVKFATDADALFNIGEATVEVTATALITGIDGNVPAGTLTRLDEPLSAIESVTNPVAASGGLDDEPLAALEQRAPLAIRAGNRAITAEDFEAHALSVAGVLRARAFVPVGTAIVHVVDALFNAVPDTTLQSTVKEYLLERTLPNLSVVVYQPTVRLVRVDAVQLELDKATTTATIAPKVAQALAQAITALDLYADDGYTVSRPGWTWGSTLYSNYLVAVLGSLEGVRRVGEITISYSDDYGTTWSTSETLVSLAPLSLDYGLLHHLDDWTPTITEL